MRYCIINRRTNRIIFFSNKRELIDWICSHSFCLSVSLTRKYDLYRVVARRVPTLNPFYFESRSLVGPYICSLREYIVKHKLM